MISHRETFRALFGNHFLDAIDAAAETGGGRRQRVPFLATVVEIVDTREVDQLFETELRGAIATVVDTKFISLITTGLTPIPSTGETAAQIRADVAAAYAAITTGAASKLYWLTTSAIAKALSTTSTTSGDSAFPGMGPQGGVLAGTPVLVSDGVPNGQMILLDAAAIAAASDTVEIDVTTKAALQLESTPTDPATASTVLTSLWQNNLVGLKCARFFGAARLGESVAVINAVSYDSPA